MNLISDISKPLSRSTETPSNGLHEHSLVMDSTAANKIALPNSLVTIGRLVSGFGDQTTGQYRSPVIDAKEMARGLKVTFRPMPDKAPAKIREFAECLRESLREQGVNVLPWEKATSPYFYEIALPLKKKPIRIPARLTHTDIDAVFDLYCRTPLRWRVMRTIMEGAYRVHRRFSGLKSRHRVREILRFVWWTEDHAIKNIRDHVRTQIVNIRPIEKFLADPKGDYKAKLAPGLRLLVESLSQMVIGVDENKLSLLNMNLSDTVYSRADLDHFVLKSLIPKLHAPITPLTKGRFQINSFNTSENPYVPLAVELGQRLAPLDLLPDAVSLKKLVRRASTRDVVNMLVNGRSGISFGFVAYMEPPVYDGPEEISPEEWEKLPALKEFPRDEVRKNERGRWYVRTISQSQPVYRQVPDVWIVCSRSGAEKKQLNPEKDIVRLGFNGSLQLHVPEGPDWEKSDVRPSYDTYVIIALALGTAIYQPDLVHDGAPIVHFHGYPRADWFQEGEVHVGENNPSVACGTFESGVLNYAGLWRLSESNPDLRLATLIEPDHGTNMIGESIEYLMERIEEGVKNGQIVLGGQNLKSLRDAGQASAAPCLDEPACT